MKLFISGAEEAGMSEEMLNNCKKLLMSRIKELPKEGDEIELLYSEKDPLQENDLWDKDDEAFILYFSVVNVETLNENDPENSKITIELNF